MNMVTERKRRATITEEEYGNGWERKDRYIAGEREKGNKELKEEACGRCKKGSERKDL